MHSKDGETKELMASMGLGLGLGVGVNVGGVDSKLSSPADGTGLTGYYVAPKSSGADGLLRGAEVSH